MLGEGFLLQLIVAFASDAFFCLYSAIFMPFNHYLFFCSSSFLLLCYILLLIKKFNYVMIFPLLLLLLHIVDAQEL